MAVQKSRKTRSKGGMHRSHQARELSKPALAVDSTTGETHRRHHITESGYYRGREVVSLPVSALIDDSDSEVSE